jgi:hypothetical protein
MSLQPNDNLDPNEQDRQYYRNARTGNLGWLVRRDGHDMIRLDRPQEEILFPFSAGEWELEDRPRALGPGVAARIAFEAYKALCHVTGKPNRAKMEWHTMSEQARIDFTKKGPKNPTELESRLWLAITKTLAEFS